MSMQIIPEVLPDQAEIHRFLALLHPDNVFEVRAIPLKRGGSCAVGYYLDHAQAAEDVIELGQEWSGMYCTLNPVKAELLSRGPLKVGGAATKDVDILCRRWALIDIDPVRPASASASAEERDAAGQVASKVVEDLRSEGWPDPKQIDSGNGFHLLYRLEFENTLLAELLVSNFLRALAGRFDTPAAKIDTSVSNASRITKIAGTVARKAMGVGRPHRVARILAQPW